MSLPEVKFLKDIVVGAIKTGDVHISNIGKSLKESKKYKHTEKRLRRNIGKENLWKRSIKSFLISNKKQLTRLSISWEIIVISRRNTQKDGEYGKSPGWQYWRTRQWVSFIKYSWCWRKA